LFFNHKGDLVKTILTTLVCSISLALSCATTAHAQEYKERTIRFGHLVNKDHPISAGVRKFAELVEKGSGGKIKVKEFPSAQLGAEQQQQAALQGGTQDMTVGATSAAVGVVKELGLLDFPFLFATEQQADQLLDGPVGRKLLDRFEPKGTIGLVYWDNLFRNVTNSRHPVKTVADLAGLKIRVQQSPIYMGVFKELGTNPVPMSFAELFTALETRTVDAQETPYPLIYSNRFYEVQKYLAVTRHSYSPLVVQFSKKVWDGMSPAEQKLIRESITAARDFQRIVSREEDVKSFAGLKAKGMEVTTFNEAEREKMKATAKPAVDRLLGEYDPALVKEFMAEVARVTR
jgi:tripartite ATP-independent transporter DctP family solute receptor